MVEKEEPSVAFQSQDARATGSRARLTQIAEMLNVDPSFFNHRRDHRSTCTQDMSQMKAFTASPEGASLIAGFMAIEDATLRGHLIELIFHVSALKPQA